MTVKKGEAAVQRAILDYLAARHVLAFRMQSGATMSSYKGKTRLVRYGTPGMADILAMPIDVNSVCEALLAVRPIWIECKAEKGKQSELQKSFQQQVESHGHKYVVARSIQDVEDALPSFLCNIKQNAPRFV